MNLDALIKAVQSVLTDDLRRAPWKGSPIQMAGHCYVASEALYHLSGGKLRPYFVRHENSPHWFLKAPDGTIVDPTFEQFKTPVPYEKGVGKGFLTKQPSKRAQQVIDRVKKGASAATKDPFRNMEQDIQDAMEHAEPFDANVPNYTWHTTKNPNMSLNEVLATDDISSWGEWAEGELEGLGPDELVETLRGFRGPEWAKKARSWFNDGFPAIVIVETPEYVGIADGRGRVSLAYGLGLQTIPAVVMKAQVVLSAANRITADETPPEPVGTITFKMQDKTVQWLDQVIGQMADGMSGFAESWNNKKWIQHEVTVTASSEAWAAFYTLLWELGKKYHIPDFVAAIKKIVAWRTNKGKKRTAKPKVKMEHINIAGLPVSLVGFDERDKHDVEDLRLFKDVLEGALKKIRETFGIKSKFPDLEVNFHGNPKAQASYYVGQNKIVWFAKGNNFGYKYSIKTFAHEFGHFVLSNYVDSKAKKAWIDLVEQDKVSIAVKDIGAAWQEGENVSQFLERLKKDDPLMFLKVEYVLLYEFKGSVVPTRAQLLRSNRVLSLSQHPVTPYGHTDPEEAFCEAFGQYIAYGPRTVHPLVRSWMRAVLPESKIQASKTTD